MKRTCLAAAVLISSIILCAQEGFKPSTYLGVQGGLNICRVSFRPAINQNLHSASGYGIIFRHVSEPSIGLQAEVNWGQKGWIENLDSLGTYKRTLAVAEIPLTAAFIAGRRIMRFGFNIGPYLSYRRQESEKINLTDTAGYRAYYTKPLEDKTEFGFLAGLSVEVHTKIGVFGIKGSYSHSLTNLFPLNVADYYYQISRMQVLQTGIFYLVRL